MPATTYLRAGEFTAATSNATLNELLRDVRKVTGEDWRIGERVIRRARLFRRPVESRVFELYVGLEQRRPASVREAVAGAGHGAEALARALWGADGEFQVINFYRDHEWTINTANSAELVAAYLYGMLAGHDVATKRTGPAAA